MAKDVTRSLFGIYDVVDIEAIEGISAEARIWLREMVRRHLLDYWIDIAITVIKTASNPLEAIYYWNDVINSKKGKKIITMGDMKRGNPHAKRLVKKANIILNGTSPTGDPIFDGKIGTHSHRFAGWWITGLLPSETPEILHQSSLFDPPNSQLNLDILMPNYSKIPFEKAFDEMSQLWKYLASIKQPAECLRYIREFRDLSNPVFCPVSQSISGQSLNEFKELQAMRSWASWAINHREEIWPAFLEVNSTNKELNFPCGRIDLLKIETLDGEPVTREQSRAMIQRHGVNISAGALILAIEKAYRKKAGVTVTDFKFAVGDCPTLGDEILFDQISGGPLSSHFDQVSGYLPMLDLDYHMARCRDLGVEPELNPEAIWHGDSPITGASIIYILPGFLPVTHKFDLTPEDRAKLFSRFVNRMKKPRTEEKASFRESCNAVGSHLSQFKRVQRTTNGR